MNRTLLAALALVPGGPAAGTPAIGYSDYRLVLRLSVAEARQELPYQLPCLSLNLQAASRWRDHAVHFTDHGFERFAVASGRHCT